MRVAEGWRRRAAGAAAPVRDPGGVPDGAGWRESAGRQAGWRRSGMMRRMKMMIGMMMRVRVAEVFEVHSS